MRTRGKEWTLRLGLLIAGLLVALLAAEGLVRLFGLAPEVALIQKGRFQLSSNIKIGYEPAPLTYDGDELEFFDYRGSSNSLGYRDREHAVEKPAGTYRILILGDSIGAGLKIDRYEDTFPAILETSLRERGREVEVVNFSVSGYNTQQEVETLKDKGLIYDPDLVVVAYCLNDRILDDGYILGTLLEQQLENPGVPEARMPPVYTKSALFRMIKYRLMSTQRPTVPKDLAPYYKAISRDTVDESILDLGRVAEENGFQALVAVVPVLQDLDAYPHLGEHRRMLGLVSSAELRFLDLLDPLRVCGDDSSIAYDLYHPNELGHQCIGDALASYIEGQLLDGR